MIREKPDCRMQDSRRRQKLCSTFVSGLGMEGRLRITKGNEGGNMDVFKLSLFQSGIKA